MNDKNELGLKLKSHREAAFEGMGLRRVADKVGIDYAHLFRIEAGQYVPSDENLLKLLNAYQVNPREKLEIFNLARLSPGHHEVIKQAYADYPTDTAFAGAFYRKEKKPKRK